MTQKAMEVYKLWHSYQNNFPKFSRFSFCEKIDSLFIGMLENLFLARYGVKGIKLAYVDAAGAKLDLIKFFIQIAWELNILDNKKFSAISVPLNEIGMMIGGWKKSLE